MNIYEKLSDFLFNLIQLIIGGIIFATIMADTSLHTSMLYILASISVAVLFVGAIILHRISKKKEA
jgi:Na+/H+ antiporter NhaC